MWYLDNNLTEADLQYEQWFYENEEQILLELAETGADREMCFDLEAEFDKRYEQYTQQAIIVPKRIVKFL